jgi:hypothetical protein
MSVTPPCDAADMVTIDCAECVMRETAACDDCVVTFVVGRRPGEALIIDVEEERAVRMLAGAGLVPRLRHRAAGS